MAWWVREGSASLEEGDAEDGRSCAAMESGSLALPLGGDASGISPASFFFGGGELMQAGQGRGGGVRGEGEIYGGWKGGNHRWRWGVGGVRGGEERDRDEWRGRGGRRAWRTKGLGRRGTGVRYTAYKGGGLSARSESQL